MANVAWLSPGGVLPYTRDTHAAPCAVFVGLYIFEHVADSANVLAKPSHAKNHEE